MDYRFDCRMCGHCCEGAGGIVVSPKDLARLCLHLELTPEGFFSAYGEMRGGKMQVKAGGDGFCIFFEPGKGCRVHEAKPDICRAWPYFRGNLVSSGSLAFAKGFCPGIPEDMAFEDFRDEGLHYLHSQGICGTGGAGEAAALQVSDLLRPLAEDGKKV